MIIPKQIIDRVKQGKAILFLGSGALHGATIPNKNIPLGNDLRDILCNEYLNESFKSSELSHVAAMAISQTSLFEVQDFIKEYFSGLQPAEFHKQIPLFNWRALFTTNYDLLIENCYMRSSSSVQDLHIVLSNEDNLDETRVTNNKLPLLKLHGCVTRTHDSSLPLILTTDQYNDCLTKRNRLFTHLYELSYENTLIFVGHSLLDHNIRSVLLKLEKEAPHGQRHYLLKPGIDQIETNFWGEKKITALDVTFKAFIEEISENISSKDRLLSLVRPPSSHPIQSVFSSHKPPSVELIDFLNNQVEWITSNTTSGTYDPKDFFRGMDQDWFPVIENIAIKRNLQLSIFDQLLDRSDADGALNSDFFVIKGEAGSGKTILLRQLAWQVGNSEFGLALWVKDNGIVDGDLIDELTSKTSERVYLFWDNAAKNAIEQNRFLHKARRKNLKVTMITAERYNEWNVRCEELDELISREFKLHYLSEKEIDLLVHQLEKCKSLGPNLIEKNHESRCKELKEMHGRQLLVALHEATMGEPFEDIVFNEYENIFPEIAKNIYLTVCTLNRLKVPVRAGLISRIHDISFSDFKEKFYRPLEKVVITKGASDQDAHYLARHSEIADIVFRRALSNTEDRYREYINVINKLNISFSSDNSSFRSLVKAKSLNELFSNFEDVASIYKHAEKAVGNDPYLLQQMANYERIRPNGSMNKALELLLAAKDDAPYDSSILHSLYAVWRDKAESADDLNVKRKCRAEAIGYLGSIISKWGMSSYISSSLIRLSIDELRDLLSDDNTTSKSVRDAIRKVQLEITENKQKYPSDGHLYSLEATFAKLIEDHARALKALERSFEENDREPFLAIRLASNYLRHSDTEKAKSILQSALDRRRSDHSLNYHYAELLRNDASPAVSELKYFYRRGFTPGDNNYEAQFWFARYLYNSIEGDDHQKAKNIFEGLRRAKISHDNKVKIREIDGGETNPKYYEGKIVRKRSGFGFIRIDGSGHEIYFPISSVVDDLWEAIQEGDRVRFNLGYSYNGAVACHITC